MRRADRDSPVEPVPWAHIAEGSDKQAEPAVAADNIAVVAEPEAEPLRTFAVEAAADRRPRENNPGNRMFLPAAEAVGNRHRPGHPGRNLRWVAASFAAAEVVAPAVAVAWTPAQNNKD